MKKSLTIFLGIGTCVFLFFFCNVQTKNFRLYQLLSNLPNDPKWEVPPLPIKEQESIKKKLNQPFTYLGSGGQCIAFLGEDQQTVLKFYKHTHLTLSNLLKEGQLLEGLLFRAKALPQESSYFQSTYFSSCVLNYTLLKERTGLLCVHLNKTKGEYGVVSLIDPIGIHHTLDLDKTEFVLQERATVVIEELEMLIKNNQVETAKERVKEMLLCLKELYSTGLSDQDLSFRKNFGYIHTKAVVLDLSSFIFDASLLTQSSHKQEVSKKTYRLARHLKKYHPELYQTYLSELEKL